MVQRIEKILGREFCIRFMHSLQHYMAIGAVFTLLQAVFSMSLLNVVVQRLLG